MTEAELECIAEGWIRYQLAEEGSAEQAANWDFVSKSLTFVPVIRRSSGN